MTWLSYMLDCQLFGPNPCWHHITNLIFHITNALLLFWILKKMTGSLWRSAFVVFLFALHPIHIESVAWIAERKDVLSGFFWMLTLAAYIRYVECPSVKKYLAIILVFGLGLMAKPMLVTLPFVLVLLDYWPLERFRSLKEKRLSLGYLTFEKLPLFVLAIGSSIITFIAQRVGGAISSIDKVPMMLRIENTLISYVKYLGKMIYPHRLSVLYPYQAFSKWNVILCFLTLFCISVVVLYRAKRNRYLVVGWLWYLGTLVPVIGLVQVGSQSMADRYTYLPSIGIFIIVVWGLFEIAGRWRFGKFILAVTGGAVLVALLICTRLQVRHWRNNFTLFEHAVKVTENNYIMINNYGAVLYQKNRVNEAIEQFNKALRINPKHFKSKNNLGIAYSLKGNLVKAIDCWRETLKMAPDFADVLNNLGWVLATTKNTEIYNSAEAIKFAQKACEITEYNNPEMLDTLAAGYAAVGKFPEAVKTADKAMRKAEAIGKKELVKEIQKRLQLYKAGQPYYE